MAEVLRFRFPPCFDPVPFPIWEQLGKDKMVAIAKAQLRMQKSMLMAQQRAINEAIRILG